MYAGTHAAPRKVVHTGRHAAPRPSAPRRRVRLAVPALALLAGALAFLGPLSARPQPAQAAARITRAEAIASFSLITRPQLTNASVVDTDATAVPLPPPPVAVVAQQQPAAPAVTPSGTAQQIAVSMLASYGWDSSQFSCLEPLWARESGWSTTASNPGSGAYGIPQALPGSKMASAGSDWEYDAATQIRWGLGYIQARYGSPCTAWAHEQATGWY